MNYRHAFHAGNHADVLKHLVISRIIALLSRKEAPLAYLDSHAGVGLYDLQGDQATRTGEWLEGIGRLWDAKGLPPAVTDYVDLVRQLNPDGQLKHYPGSPWLARQLLRDSDRLRVFEMHSTDIRLLQECFKGSGRAVTVSEGDGFAGLKALLPPPTRRALVLIDPSYETKSDYTSVIKGLQEALRRFPTGTYALWYPMLAKLESRQLPGRLRALGASNWLHATLEVKAPARDGFGMNGSGMFIINPPWTLEKKLHETLPRLTELLAQGEGAKYTLESEST